jgi:hypothetical protein
MCTVTGKAQQQGDGIIGLAGIIVESVPLSIECSVGLAHHPTVGWKAQGSGKGVPSLALCGCGKLGRTPVLNVQIANTGEESASLSPRSRKASVGKLTFPELQLVPTFWTISNSQVAIDHRSPHQPEEDNLGLRPPWIRTSRS